MLSDKVENYFNKFANDMDLDLYRLLKEVYTALEGYEKKESKQDNESGKGKRERSYKFNKVGKLAKKCFEQAWEIATSRVMPENTQYELAAKLCQMMMCQVRDRKRIKALSPLLEYLKPKSPKTSQEEINEMIRMGEEFIKKTYGSMADDPIERGDQGQFEKRIEIESEDNEEKPDITASSVINLQKAMDEESGGSLSMDVLCYDDTAHLGLVKTVRQILYTREKISDNYFVCRIVEKQEAVGPVVKCGLLISS